MNYDTLDSSMSLPPLIQKIQDIKQEVAHWANQPEQAALRAQAKSLHHEDSVGKTEMMQALMRLTDNRSSAEKVQILYHGFRALREETGLNDPVYDFSKGGLAANYDKNTFAGQSVRQIESSAGYRANKYLKNNCVLSVNDKWVFDQLSEIDQLRVACHMGRCYAWNTSNEAQSLVFMKVHQKLTQDHTLSYAEYHAWFTGGLESLPLHKTDVYYDQVNPRPTPSMYDQAQNAIDMSKPEVKAALKRAPEAVVVTALCTSQRPDEQDKLRTMAKFEVFTGTPLSLRQFDELFEPSLIQEYKTLLNEEKEKRTGSAEFDQYSDLSVSSGEEFVDHFFSGKFWCCEDIRDAFEEFLDTFRDHVHEVSDGPDIYRVQLRFDSPQDRQEKETRLVADIQARLNSILQSKVLPGDLVQVSTEDEDQADWYREQGLDLDKKYQVIGFDGDNMKLRGVYDVSVDYYDLKLVKKYQSTQSLDHSL